MHTQIDQVSLAHSMVQAKVLWCQKTKEYTQSHHTLQLILSCLLLCHFLPILVLALELDKGLQVFQ